MKKLRGMRTRAKQKSVAEATALGGGVPQAELFPQETQKSTEEGARRLPERMKEYGLYDADGRCEKRYYS